MVALLDNCPTCGTAVPPDARTLGLCPRCLMRSALGASPDLHRRASQFIPPDPSEIRCALPNLDLLELLGQGGMGAVYRARQRSLDRHVAVKLFPREIFDDPTFDQRFQNEARILASLSHPNVIAAHEFGETDRFCYLVMELIDGVSLRHRMQEAKQLSLEETIWIARQVCDALAYAHSRGIVHRDIKPENILLEGDTPGAWRVRVADFGLAKLIEQHQQDWSLTAPNRLMGTPDYMAPEQRQSPSSVDPRADIYALGVVIYEMLAGQLPIGLFAPPTDDPRASAVVLRCLEPAPSNRYPNVETLRHDLEALLVAPPAQTPRWPAIAAYGGIAAFLMIGVLATFIALRDPPPLPTGFVATSQPATDRAFAGAGSRQSQPNRTFAPPPISHFPDTTIGIARPRTGFADPPWADMRGPDIRGPAYTSPRNREEFIKKATDQFGPNSAVTFYVRNVPAQSVDPLCDHLKQLTGATHRWSTSSNGFVTLCLAPVQDLNAIKQKLNFGPIDVDPANRTITLTADPKKLPAQ
jgi:serine/threonine protein kinase